MRKYTCRAQARSFPVSRLRILAISVVGGPDPAARRGARRAHGHNGATADTPALVRQREHHTGQHAIVTKAITVSLAHAIITASHAHERGASALSRTRRAHTPEIHTYCAGDQAKLVSARGEGGVPQCGSAFAHARAHARHLSTRYCLPLGRVPHRLRAVGRYAGAAAHIACDDRSADEREHEEHDEALRPPDVGAARGA